MINLRSMGQGTCPFHVNYNMGHIGHTRGRSKNSSKTDYMLYILPFVVAYFVTAAA